MEIEFDPAKDAANRQRHGFPLTAGAFVIRSARSVELDARRDYGEARLNAYGFFAGRPAVCTSTVRGLIYRIISVRVAGRKEHSRWFG